MDVAQRLMPENLPLIKSVMDSTSYYWMEKYVQKIQATPNGIYGFVKNGGVLPPNVPKEVYYERAAYSCSDPIHDAAFMQDYDLLNTKVLYKSEYVIYNIGTIQLLRKYSTYTHDFVLHGLWLHE